MDLSRRQTFEVWHSTDSLYRSYWSSFVFPFDVFFFFTGVYTFGLFTVDIFVNAGQVVTGNLAPYFLTVCKPNYTALGCQQTLRYISHQEACTGNQDDILRARKTFPSKEAALSVYAALYLAVSLSIFSSWCKFELNYNKKNTF